MKRIVCFLYIILGAFILAIGINIFLVPQKLSTGGVSGIGTVLKYAFDIPLSVTNAVINAILFIFGFRLLGKTAVIKTAFGIIMLTVFLEATSYLPIYEGDIFSSFLAGSVLVCIGVGIVVRQGASTGGSDFSGLMINKFTPHISIARIMLFIDCLIVAVSGLVFKSISVMIYSLGALYISAKISDYILVLGDNSKSVYIFSSCNETIAQAIMNGLQRGVTAIQAKGMYSQKEREILFCAVSPKELPKIVALVRKNDEKAFMIINDVHKVLGEGFKNIFQG